jgi:hypothetical protein
MGERKYLPGQPAVAYLEITNKGLQSISVIDQLDPQFDVVKFYVIHSQKEVLFVPYAVADIIPHVINLDSNNSIRGYAKIFYGSGGYTFPTPGKYQVKATYQGLIDKPGEIIQSNIVDFEVKSPEDKQENDQVNLIKGNEQALFFLFEGGDHLTNGLTMLTELASKYPVSTLGAYANAALGLHWSKNFKDFQKNRVRKADMERATSFLNVAKENVSGHWADSTYLTLARIHENMDSKDSMKNVLNEFVTRFGDNDKNAETVELARKLLREKL